MTAQILAFPTTPLRHQQARIAQGRNLLALWQPAIGDLARDLTTGRTVKLVGHDGYAGRTICWAVQCTETGISGLRVPTDLAPILGGTA